MDLLPSFTPGQNSLFWKQVVYPKNVLHLLITGLCHSLFPQCFLAIWITFCQFSSNLKLLSANPFSLEDSKICCLGKGYTNYTNKDKWPWVQLGKSFIQDTLNPFPNKPWFLRVCSTSLLKILWEKEKLLVTSNFSFSHSVFYPFWEFSAMFFKFEIVVCKLCQHERV